MIRILVDKYLKTVMNELFIDPGNFHVSMGPNIFSDSTLNLKKLTVRPDIFDVCLQPLRLVSGHVGKFCLDGIAELAFSGKVRLLIEDVYLLLEVHTAMGAERAQLLKKILLEMRSGKMQQVILREILKKIQGLPLRKDPNIKEKRKLSKRMIKYLFSCLTLSIKNVHIRIEIPAGPMSSVNAVGMIVPMIKVSPTMNGYETSASLKLNGLSKSEQVLWIALKRLVTYCDYGVASYTFLNGKTSIAEVFESKKSAELHVSMLLLLDLNIYLGAEIVKGTDMLSSKVAVDWSQCNFSIDAFQLASLQQLLDTLVAESKRLAHLTRVRGIFGRIWAPPRINEIGGIHIFPCLTIQHKKYPTDPSALPSAEPSTTNQNSMLITLLKSRLGPNWAKGIWRHVTRLVMENNRLAKPLGRWIELIKLLYIRKQYVFIYSKLLHRSADTGNLIFNVHAKVDSTVVMKLFELEMILPIDTVYLFRKMAVMLNFVELMNGKRKQNSNKLIANTGSSATVSTPTVGADVFGNTFEKTSISWSNLLRINIEIVEQSKVSMFHRGEKLNDIDDGTSDAGGGDIDDSRSTYAGDDSRHKSLGAWAVRSYTSVSSTVTGSNYISSTISKSSSTSKSIFNTSSSSSNGKSVTTGESNNNRSSSGGGEKSIFGNTDFTAFMDWIGGVEKEDKVQDSNGGMIGTAISSLVGGFSNGPSSSSNTSLSSPAGNVASRGQHSPKPGAPSTMSNSPNPQGGSSADTLFLKDIRMEIFDWHLSGLSPSELDISDAVKGILYRYRSPFSIIPPDISFKVTTLSLALRCPLEAGKKERANLATLHTDSLNVSVSIASSPISAIPQTTYLGSTPSKGKANSALETSFAGKGSIASLEGSLIQVRLSVSQAKMTLFVNDPSLADVITNGVDQHQQELQKLSSLKYVESSIQQMTSQSFTPTPNTNDDATVDDSSSVGYDDEQEDNNSIVYGNYNYGKTTSLATPSPNGTSSGSLSDREVDETKIATDSESYRDFSTPAFGALSLSGESRSEPIKSQAIELFSSCKDNRFMVVCLLLDYGRKGEGAADLQTYIGDLSMDLNGNALSCFLDERTIGHIESSLDTMKQISQTISMANSPYKYFLRDLRSDAKVDGSERGALLSLRQLATKKAIIENLNYKYWHSFYDYFMPRDVTVILKSSKIHADLLSANIIRNIVLSIAQEVSDRASGQRHQATDFQLALNSGHNLQFLRDLRRWATRNCVMKSDGSNRGQLVLSPIEIGFQKSSEPSAGMELKAFGIELQLPINDEELCHGLALCFGKYLPHY